MNGLQGLKKNKCLTNFGFKLKLESPNYRQIKFCHLCQNWMSIQWQRAPVLIFFAFKLGTISGQLLARISCQPSTWRHVSILLSAIFCSISLTLKDILACRAPNPVNKILKVYIQQRNLICHVWEHSVVCVIPTFHKCQQFLFSRLWKGWRRWGWWWRPWNINRIFDLSEKQNCKPFTTWLTSNWVFRAEKFSFSEWMWVN